MNKYLKLSSIVAFSVFLAACSDETPSKVANKQASETKLSTTSQNSSEAKTGSSTQNSESTTNSNSETNTTSTPEAKQTGSVSKIKVNDISSGNLSSILGTYPALNGGTYTIKDNKTIVYTVDGEEKILTITGYGQQEGVAVANAVFSSIGGKPVDASAPSPGGNGAVFYFVPAGQKSPLGFFGGTEDTSRDRVVTLNNAFYLN